MATDRTSLTLTDDRRRLEDRARGKIDGLPDQQWRTTLYDVALTHLDESIENAKTIREEGSVPPEYYRAMSTSVVKLHYRTELEVSR